MNSFTTSNQQAGVQPSLGNQGSVMHSSYLGRQMPQCQMSSPSFFFAQLLLLSMTELDIIGHGISLWSAGVSCSSCVPSQLLVHPQPTHWGGAARRRKGFDSV